MKRKIITDNAKRTVGKKATVEEQLDSKSKSPIGVLGNTPADAIASYYKAKGNQAIPEPVGNQSLNNPKSYLGGQAVSSGGYQPWKPGNTPNLDEMNAMLAILGGGPLKGGADAFMASSKTYEKLIASFGSEVANDLSALHGIKIQVVPGMPDDKMLAINQSVIDKFKNEYFAKQFMQEWPPAYCDEKKEEK